MQDSCHEQCLYGAKPTLRNLPTTYSLDLVHLTIHPPPARIPSMNLISLCKNPTKSVPILKKIPTQRLRSPRTEQARERSRTGSCGILGIHRLQRPNICRDLQGAEGRLDFLVHLCCWTGLIMYIYSQINRTDKSIHVYLCMY